MKIGIIGNYGATNVGDDAILSTLLTQLSGHQLTVFSADPRGLWLGKKVKSAHLFPLGIRSFFKYGFRPSIHALKNLDVVILGGGGLFQDSYLYACFLWAWQVFWVKSLKKPLFIWATGVGSLNTWLGKKLTQWAYDQADSITVRDQDSAELLAEIGVKKKIIITADPVFTHAKRIATQGRKIKPPHRQQGLFVISLRPWLDQNQKIIRAFTPFLENLKNQKRGQFIFVCMQEIKEDDLKVIQPIMEKVGGEFYSSKNVSDLIGVMEQAEFAIGMRYHFMIAALIAGTPLIPVSYAPKTENLFRATPLEPYIIKLEDLNSKKLQSVFQNLSTHYNDVLIDENKLVQGLLLKARENFKYLNHFIKKFDPSKKK